MKVLQVLFSGLGGHGSVAFSLVRGDVNRVFQHGMIFYGIEPLATGYAEACHELGIAHEVVGKRPGLDLQSLRSFIGAVRRARPDVIVLHSTSLVGTAAAYARRSKIPLLVVDHLSNQVKKPRDWGFVALALTLARGTVFLTDAFAAEVKARLPLLYDPDRVHVIGNGIDVEAFAPRVDRVGDPATIRVGMHSRFSPSKDHGTLIRALSLLPPDTRVRLALAGAGETLAAAQGLTRELGLEDRVDFLGMLPESDLPAYLGSLDIYVQSTRGETMSTSVMQAMAAGLPVVGSDVPGVRNMIDEGRTGLLFPARDADALAGILRQLAGDGPRRQKLGQEAAAHARKSWSHQAMFDAYDRLLSQVIREAEQGHRPNRVVPYLGKLMRALFHKDS